MGPKEHWYREQVFAAGKVPVHAIFAAHDEDVPLHDHAFVEIVAVLDGSARHVTSAGEKELRAGDVLVLRPGVWHGYSQANKLRIFNVCFGAELLNRELAWTLEDPVVGQLLWGPRHGGGGANHFNASAAVVKACAHGLGDVHAPEGWAVPIGRLLVFLGALSQGANVTSASVQVIPPLVAEVVRSLEADVPRAWRMDELAKIAGVNPSYLTRRFTAAMGLAPMAYLTRCRAERAAALLLQTTDDIARIATIVGWPDPVYFSRRFRQHYGMAPREYRKRFGQQTTALSA